MLKTFNVTETYEEIIPFLDRKKNQSRYLCDLISREMKKEEFLAEQTERDKEIFKKIECLIKNSEERIIGHLYRVICVELRELIKTTIADELNNSENEKTTIE